MNLRHTGLLLTALIVGACGGGVEVASDTAVRIAEAPIAYDAFEDYLENNADTAGLPVEQRLDDAVLTSLFDTFIEEHLLVRLAADLGLADEPAPASRRQIVERLLRHAQPSAPSVAEIEAYYERFRSRWAHSEEVRLWQILMVDRERTEAVKRELDRGADFKATAVRLVDDPDANYCGDQGWLGQDDLPPSLAAVIFALEPGTYSDVVAADHNYYIFWVEARKEAHVKPLAEVEADIRASLARERSDRAMAEAIAEARTRYNVAVFPTNLPFDYQGQYAEPQED